MAPRTLQTLALARGGARLCQRGGRVYAPALMQTRGIAESWKAKVAAGEKEWNTRGKEIRAGTRQHVWDIINERGFVKDVAG